MPVLDWWDLKANREAWEKYQASELPAQTSRLRELASVYFSNIPESKKQAAMEKFAELAGSYTPACLELLGLDWSKLKMQLLKQAAVADASRRSNEYAALQGIFAEGDDHSNQAMALAVFVWPSLVPPRSDTAFDAFRRAGGCPDDNWESLPLTDKDRVFAAWTKTPEGAKEKQEFAERTTPNSLQLQTRP